MNVTSHARERYLERIEGILDIDKRKDLLKNDIQNTEEKIIDLYNNGHKIFEGSLYEKQPSSSFYLSDNIILVLNAKNESIITLYKVDFGFSESTNRATLLSLLEDVTTLEEEIDLVAESSYFSIDKLESEICSNEFQIQSLESQLFLLKENNKLLETNKKTIENQLQNKILKKETALKSICNSMKFKMDILALNN